MVLGLIKRLRGERGATAIEYGLLAALIGIGVMTGVSATGSPVEEGFVKIGDCMTNTDPANTNCQP